METLLAQYNPHWIEKKSFDLIRREKYCSRIMELVDRKEILVLQGIRRSGKSSLLKLVINELMKKRVNPKNILFMNLEDYRFGSEKSVNTLDEIYQNYTKMNTPKGKIYILLDEIQEIPDFEKWLRTYYEQNESIKFIITGSSSSLFSKELATLLTGRQISFEVFPFSFSEYLDFRESKIQKDLKKKPIDLLYLSPLFKKIEPLLLRYLDEGGFPEMIKQEQQESNILALQQYISDIILRDIAQRYNIRKIEVLQKLALYLIYNMGGFINMSRIAQLVGTNRTTLLELLAYLKEVYLVFPTSSFSLSIDEQLSPTKPKKIYCIDNGFFAAIKTESEKDFIKKVKNIVFQHLRFQWGEELFYWRDKVEVDFVTKDGFPINALPSNGDIDMEIHKLFHFMNRFNLPQGLLINWERLQIIEENERKIVMMPLWLFLTKTREEILDY